MLSLFAFFFTFSLNFVAHCSCVWDIWNLSQIKGQIISWRITFLCRWKIHGITLNYIVHILRNYWLRRADHATKKTLKFLENNSIQLTDGLEITAFGCILRASASQYFTTFDYSRNYTRNTHQCHVCLSWWHAKLLRLKRELLSVDFCFLIHPLIHHLQTIETVFVVWNKIFMVSFSLCLSLSVCQVRQGIFSFLNKKKQQENGAS